MTQRNRAIELAVATVNREKLPIEEGKMQDAAIYCAHNFKDKMH